MLRKKAPYLFLSIAVFIFFISVMAYTAIQPVTTPPDSRLLKTSFPKNERIVYKVTWFGIKAGDITFMVKDRGKDKWHILAVARSSSLFSLFYPVEDIFETEVSGPEMLPEWIVIRQKEGKYRSFKRVMFDQSGLKIVYEKDDEETVTYSIPRPAHNEISSFFIMRVLPMSIGRSVFVETFASRKSYTVEVKVLQRDRLQTGLGELTTIKVKPVLLFEGVHERTGDVYVWLTDDKRRIPVQVKGAIRIGSLVARLAGWQVFE